MITTAFGAFDLNGTYCNLAADYVDGNTINVCEGTDKFVRTWTILDWCTPGDITEYTQVIKVGDATAPALSCPTADYDWDGENDLLTYSTGPFNCTAAFQVPMPAVSDACSDNAIAWLEGELGRFRGTLFFVTHDRAFLRQVARRIVELDRQQVLLARRPFSHLRDEDPDLVLRELSRLRGLPLNLPEGS